MISRLSLNLDLTQARQLATHTIYPGSSLPTFTFALRDYVQEPTEAVNQEYRTISKNLELTPGVKNPHQEYRTHTRSKEPTPRVKNPHQDFNEPSEVELELLQGKEVSPLCISEVQQRAGNSEAESPWRPPHSGPLARCTASARLCVTVKGHDDTDHDDTNHDDTDNDDTNHDDTDNDDTNHDDTNHDDTNHDDTDNDDTNHDDTDNGDTDHDDTNQDDP
ncbi:otolith matrix protein OMM-64-like [Homarus americanus]|uniref:otolith matrix protein OMM-64-like n=1 Tax=Homarus americanus TaxID=6706 RepID=UPI001C46D373|nr:otolith matrix protein OMM-64-like [Homarus americanus]